MRKLTLALASFALIAMAAGSAQAISTTHAFSNLVGVGTPSTATLAGNSLSGLQVGDQFEVSLEVDNLSGDTFLSIFTQLVVDPNVLQVVAGFTDGTALPPEGGFTGNNLVILGEPEAAAGQPAGVNIGVALGVSNPATGDGLYSAAAAGIVAIAVFEVVGIGDTTIDHIEAGGTDIRTGELQFSSPLNVSVVPEPGTALLMGLGLAGLAAAGRRNA